MSREAVLKRREEAYRLSLLGFSQREIAETLHITQSSVSQGIEAVRDSSVWAKKSARERYNDLLQKSHDLIMLTVKESGRLLFSPGTDPGLRIMALGRIQAGALALTRLLPDQEAIAFYEEAKALIEEVEGLRQKIQSDSDEQAIRDKIQRLPAQGS